MLGGASFTEYIVKARDSESANTAIAYIGGFLKGLIPQGSGDYEVRAADYWQQFQNESFNMIGMVLGGIAAISLLVGGIGIMNIMLVTVTERTREIGIRRAIGAQRSSIVTQFLIEAGMLCGMGGIVGIIFGTIGSVVLGRIIYQQTIYPVPWVTIAAFALSVALGVVFIPAVYYTYTGATGASSMIVDVLLFQAAVLLGAWVSWRILAKGSCIGPVWSAVGLLLLLGVWALAVWWTYDPPQRPLFTDPVTGQTGLFAGKE